MKGLYTSVADNNTQYPTSQITSTHAHHKSTQKHTLPGNHLTLCTHPNSTLPSLPTTRLIPHSSVPTPPSYIHTPYAKMFSDRLLLSFGIAEITAFTVVYSANAYSPKSLPIPLCLNPPKGTDQVR